MNNNANTTDAEPNTPQLEVLKGFAEDKPAEPPPRQKVIRWTSFVVELPWPTQGIQSAALEVADPAQLLRAFAHVVRNPLAEGVPGAHVEPAVMLKMVFIVCADAARRPRQYAVVRQGVALGVPVGMPEGACPNPVGEVMNPLTGEVALLWHIPTMLDNESIPVDLPAVDGRGPA